MLTKTYMNWIIKLSNSSISIKDLIEKNSNRAETLIILKIIENIEAEFKEKASEDELKNLTITIEKEDDNTLKTSITGNKKIIEKVSK